MEKVLFTSESVSEGHPDKVADQISDGVLDAMLRQDPYSRVACETLVSTGLCVVAGEVTTRANVNITDIVRDTIAKIGYTDPALGFEAKSCAVLVALGKQSPDISQGVTAGQGLFKEQGAGDQGMMFGFACDETPELMPLPISLANKLVYELARMRKSGKLKYLRPDAKSQVTVEYENDRPKRIDTVVISTQHAPEVSYKTIQKDMIEKLIKPLCGKWVDNKTKYFINPTGRFVIGGPHGDSGVTGRKIIVDTYGGMGRHGGGAFSGKDPSKVDRSAAYMARYIAKNLVAAKAAGKCEVQLAYAIGVAEPVSVLINTFGTSAYDSTDLVKIVRKVFSLKPAAIIDTLKLRKVNYQETAAYGHFGRSGANFTWEKTDKADAIKRELKKLS
ncbi:MAG: methionine adenosyltransferase [Elusimicrobia bacterium RIFOXYB2_FULL_49_7]|nr:MAG: methionine adenosyltransferase [Elusimicrobia bacterium RIFOXYB2_FULL_49_7]